MIMIIPADEAVRWCPPAAPVHVGNRGRLGATPGITRNNRWDYNCFCIATGAGLQLWCNYNRGWITTVVGLQLW